MKNIIIQHKDFNERVFEEDEFLSLKVPNTNLGIYDSVGTELVPFMFENSGSTLTMNDSIEFLFKNILIEKCINIDLNKLLVDNAKYYFDDEDIYKLKDLSIEEMYNKSKEENFSESFLNFISENIYDEDIFGMVIEVFNSLSEEYIVLKTEYHMYEMICLIKLELNVNYNDLNVYFDEKCNVSSEEG